MPLIRWTPFFPEPFGDFDKVFEGFPARSLEGFMPAADVYQTKDAVMVEMPLPGVDPDKVEISITDDVLTIKGATNRKSEVEDGNYYRREVRSGSFCRTLPLPVHVLGDRASAVSENGLLKISVPKAEKTKGKAVKVRVRKEKK